MALCRTYDNPSLFITFTTNPKWPEMNEMLANCNGQKAKDRPDLMRRVFKLKLGQLMRDIKENQIFGKINAEMMLDEDGFPVYKQLNNGVYVMKGKVTLDNSYVVPYNRYLLIKYDAHINVEWCNSSRAIKYLFKYINKGPDRAIVMVTKTNEEGKSITLFGVQILINIPRQEFIHTQNYRPSMFGMQRKGCGQYGRIRNQLEELYTATQLEERYYLRMLLNIIKGPISFEDVRTFKGKIYDTYREACYARGLLTEDNEWTDAIQQADL
ncbi:hypothetical protein V2J09_016438 [Rumex salicifolius]